jgi:endonuclease-8
VKRVFEANREHRQSGDHGDPRGGQAHHVYGRRGAPCRRCRTPIQRREMTAGVDGERVTYWCPSCQRA